MTAIDLTGWLAASLTLFTFVCRDMRRLRVLALAANAAFIAYGAGAALLPVLTLHALLAPVNLWRLRELVTPADAAADVPAAMAVAARTPRRHGRRPTARRVFVHAVARRRGSRRTDCSAG